MLGYHKKTPKYICFITKITDLLIPPVMNQSPLMKLMQEHFITFFISDIQIVSVLILIVIICWLIEVFCQQKTHITMLAYVFLGLKSNIVMLWLECKECFTTAWRC